MNVVLSGFFFQFILIWTKILKYHMQILLRTYSFNIYIYIYI